MELLPRILFVNTRHFVGGGDSAYTFHLADLLRSRGHEVAFFAMHDERNRPDPNLDLFVSNIDYRDLNRQKNLAAGAKVFTRAIYSAEARRNFSQLLDRFSPDIIHFQNYLLHITPSVLIEADKRSLPAVWTLHDYYLVCPNAHLLNDRTGQICEACRNRHYFQAALHRCKKGSLLASGMAAFTAYCNRWLGEVRSIDALLCPSQFLQSKLRQNHIACDKVFHVPLFLPEKHFTAAGIDHGYMLFLGKLEDLKGIRVLIEASHQVPDVQVVIAGSVSEPLAGNLPQLLPPNARYVGMKQGQELIELTQSATAVVLPSIWYENQPLSILEAFAAGKPVIASNLGGMTELVKHQERGLLVTPGDAESLAQALHWAAAHQTEMRSMGQNAREYAIDHHSPQSHYQAIMAVYARVLSEHAGSRR